MSRTLAAYVSDRPRRILELGAGSGLYTELLAKMGHEIVALEPTPNLMEMNKERIKSQKLENRVHWISADARDLKSALSAEDLQNKFDVVLNMGPFYHLVQREDREDLFKHSLEVLKFDGLHFGVFLSRVGYASYLLRRQPENLLQDPDGFRDIMTQGFFSQHPRNGIFRGHFTELNEVSELHQSCGAVVQRLHVLDPCIGADDEIFNRLSGEIKAAWVEVLFALSSDPAFWGTGRTWLVLSQRPEISKNQGPPS